MRWISFLILFIAAFLSASPVSAEYYQYTDEQGNIRFTDDLSVIPEKQQNEATTFESLPVQPDNADPQTVQGDTEPRAGVQQNAPAESDAPGRTWDAQMRVTAKEIDAEKAELDQLYRQLQVEKSELQTQDPTRMEEDVLSEYRDRVQALNDKVKNYDERRQEFQKKVDDFNKKLNK